ncbi:MAG: hypothetical protein EOO04_07780 [Chitinophagaceae bacterium]|nr:MAG: hypothetical protein EOO04_07780 [Chitinophagaceae bacterium]
MSLAIGFLIVFLLAVPGIVFRVTYLSSPYSRRNINTTTLEEIYSSLIPAFIFHSFCVIVLDLLGHNIDYQFLFNLLIGSNAARNINKLNDYLPPFLVYMFINLLLNFLAALFLRRFVLRHKLYKRYNVLSIYNKWYDILKPKSNGQEEISVWLDVVLETRNDTLIYRGFLTDFWLDKDGGIKELHMEDVRRRVLSRDEPNDPAHDHTHAAAAESTSEITEAIDERYYYIPGERFIIKYQDVRNMNITYYAEQAL